MKSFSGNPLNRSINLLVDRSLRNDKRKNIFVILTITFTVCLMTSLALYSFGKSHELKTWLQGRYQAAVIQTDMNTILQLKSDNNIESVGTEVDIYSLRVDDYTLNIKYRDEDDTYLRSVNLTGRLPEKENEVAVSAAYLEHIGAVVEVGQKISLPLEDGKEKTYTICGVINDDSSLRMYEILVSEMYLNSYYLEQIPYTAVIRIASSEHFKLAEVKEIIYSCLLEYGILEKDIAFSSSYFNSIDNSSQDMAVTMSVGLLIVLACGLVIYSIFYISVVGKIKEYGRLRIIGMTKKQIQKLVKKESGRLSRIAITTGIFFGGLIGYLLVPKGWYWPNSLKCAVITIFFTEIAVGLSVGKPAKMAAGVAPIEAIRVTATIDMTNVKGRKRSSHKISPFTLAGINFYRNRKKAVLTLLSLGFTGVMLMSAATYLNSVDEENVARKAFGDKEFSIALSPNMMGNENSYPNNFQTLQKNNPFSEEVLNKLSENNKVTKIHALKGTVANVFLPNDSNIDTDPYYQIAGLSKENVNSFQNHLLSGTMDYDTLVSEQGILVDDSAGMLKQFDHYDVKVGDIIQIETDKGEKLAFTVSGTLNMQESGYSGIYFYISEELLSEINGSITNFNYEVSVRTEIADLEATEELIINLFKDNQDIKIESFLDAINFVEKHLGAYKKPLYGLVVFIGIFGVINFINNLMTNFITRQREYGVLKSIGLSRKQLLQMLWMESLYYILGTLLITLSIGSVAGYALCKQFDNIGLFGSLHYRFPIMQVTIFTIILLGIWLVYSVVVSHFCKKISLVASIKSFE
ncbi:ABC-type lipoprotein release transport system permease subunit [Lachnotalea glycerini]|uniref:ABC-type lipoprotein release transport system permease subunit n=1 Tax=Lachnotalea glycerini TaxID=1763509 RepID=A0A318EUU7_9FIRM|nr:ABC transporter permease [Lachnotalea glycerini]PXV93360.1 ABC-type lipoprotein release transport system permease subunit [Lachnotalea glycerini]